MTYREYRREGPYVVLSFLLILFCVLCSVIFKSVLKSTFSIISASRFSKKRKTEHKYGSAVRMKIIILRAVVQSWNFADFDLYIGGETGKLTNVCFPQGKTIIMPLIFQSPVPLFLCSSVSCCPRCLRCAKWCSLCSAVSYWRLLLRCSRWISSRRSSFRGVSVENLPRRGFGATCCACVSFALEIVRDSPMVNVVSLFSF